MVKALDLSSNGRVVRVGSNPTPGRFFGQKHQTIAEAGPMAFTVSPWCKNWNIFTISRKDTCTSKRVQP